MTVLTRFPLSSYPQLGVGTQTSGTGIIRFKSARDHTRGRYVPFVQHGHGVFEGLSSATSISTAAKSYDVAIDGD